MLCLLPDNRLKFIHTLWLKLGFERETINSFTSGQAKHITVMSWIRQYWQSDKSGVACGWIFKRVYVDKKTFKDFDFLGFWGNSFLKWRNIWNFSLKSLNNKSSFYTYLTRIYAQWCPKFLHTAPVVKHIILTHWHPIKEGFFEVSSKIGERIKNQTSEVIKRPKYWR